MLLPGKNNRIIRVVALLDDIQIDAAVLFRRNGQQVLPVMHECNGTVGNFITPGTELRFAHFCQSLGSGNKCSFSLLSVKTEGCLGGEDACDSLVKTFHTQEPFVDAGKQIVIILLKILVKENHIGTGSYRCRNGEATGHSDGETYHSRRICRDQPIKAELSAQQTCHQLFTKTGRSQCFPPAGFRIQFFHPCRLGNMADHDSFCTLIDQRFINSAIGLHPFVAIEGVDTGEDVLITLIHTVTGEMFDGYCHTTFIGGIQIAGCTGNNHVRVRAKGTCVGNGIMEVPVDIHNRCKGPVETHRCTFFAGYISHPVGIFGISGCRDSHRCTKAGSFKRKAAASRFGICRKKERDFRHVLDATVRLLNDRFRSGTIHYATSIEAANYASQHSFIVAHTKRAENLAGLFFECHTCERFFNPANILIREEKWIRFIIDHNVSP